MNEKVYEKYVYGYNGKEYFDIASYIKITDNGEFKVVYKAIEIFRQLFYGESYDKTIKTDLLSDQLLRLEEERAYYWYKVKEYEDIILQYEKALGNDNGIESLINKKISEVQEKQLKFQTETLIQQESVVQSNVEIYADLIKESEQYLKFLNTCKVPNNDRSDKDLDVLYEGSKRGWAIPYETLDYDIEKAQMQIKNYQNMYNKALLERDSFNNSSEINQIENEIAALKDKNEQEQRDYISNKLQQAIKIKSRFEILQNESQHSIELEVEKEKNTTFDILKPNNSEQYLGFDYYGKLVLIGDKYNSANIVYSNNKISYVTSKDKKLASFHYGDDGNLDYITDIQGRNTRYVYDNNNLVEIVYPDGTYSKYEYYANGFAIRPQTGFYWLAEENDFEYLIQKYDVASEISKDTITEAFSHVCDYSISVEKGSKAVVTDEKRITTYNFSFVGKLSFVTEKKKTSESSAEFDNMMVYLENDNYQSQWKLTYDNYIKSLVSRFDDWSFEGTFWHNDGDCISLEGECDAHAWYNVESSLLEPGKAYLFKIKAKADSVYIDEQSENRAIFDMAAIVEYSDGSVDEKRKCFDWFVKDWQLGAVTVVIDKNKTVSSVKLLIDYKNNLHTAFFKEPCFCKVSGSEVVLEDGRKIMETDLKNVTLYSEYVGIYPSLIERIDEFGASVKERRYYNNDSQLYRSVIYKSGNEFDGNGLVTEYTYDEYGNVTEECTYHEDDMTNKFVTKNVVDDIGRIKEEYDVRGEIDGMDAKSVYTYFGETDRVKCIESAGGVKTYYGYNYLNDELIGKTVSVDGEDNTIRYHYMAGYLTEIANNDGTTINYVYDGRGRTKKILINGKDYLSNTYTENVTEGVSSETVETVYVSRGEISE